MDATTQNNPPSETPIPAPEPYAVQTVNAWRPEALLDVKEAFGELTLTVQREQIVAACETLRAAGYNFLSDVTCVDWFPSEPRFRVIYHLLSQSRKERVRLKVRVESLDPVVETITSVWPAANFYEREIFDLFGVRFGGHPNMRRILMPEDWQGHPLRKDYPVEGYR
jgi:NADH-quinone oxidoreductase subunit C